MKRKDQSWRPENAKIQRGKYKFLMSMSLCFLLAAFSWGQQAPKSAEQQEKEPPGFTIGVEVNMINVPATVRQPEGGFVTGLKQTDFRIYEDGKEQEILLFAQEGVSTCIAIVLDSSGSVRSEWGTIKYATQKFVENLKAEDKFSLITFNTEIRLKMDWGRKSDRLDAVLSSIYCKDDTKIWDAIWVVCNDVFSGIDEKKAMIIMSDGLDNRSLVSYNDALQAAIRSQAAIYVVSKTESVRQLMLYQISQNPIYFNIPHEAFAQADLLLRRLAFETGGRVLYPNSFGQLDNIYAEVSEELRSQYNLGYISSNTIKDGSYRNIQVRLNNPSYTISARPGYYAPNEMPTSP